MTDWTQAAQRIVPPSHNRMVIDPRAVHAAQTTRQFGQYAENPVAFAREVLGMTLWEGQERMLTAAATSKKVSIRSGHKISKSTTAAVIVLWRTLCRPDARTIITAPTARQVKNIIWREVRRWHSKRQLPGEMFDDPATGFRYGDAEAQGFSTDQPERMAGVSGADLMFILDEASGIGEEIFEAIEGNMAGGARLFMISNPTQTSGTFYRSHTTERHLWHTIHISSEETPNALTGESIIPGLATAEWVAEKKAQWGIDSPLYQVRVKGNFPSQAENSVMGLGLIEAACARWEDATDLAPLRLGVDVARFGDDATVIQAVRGSKALPPRELRKFDTVEVAGFVLETARAMRRGNEPVRVKIDDGGLGGGVTDILNHSEEAKLLGLEIIPLNAGSSATDPLYVRLRDQLWFGLKEWLEDGAIPNDADLVADLVAPLYSFSTAGKLLVESKKDMKKRLKRSPDRADALALAVYEAPVSHARTPATNLSGLGDIGGHRSNPFGAR